VVAVEVDGRSRPPAAPVPRSSWAHHTTLRAHRRERLGKAHVALDAVPADALDAHRPAADRPGARKYEADGGIAFDEHRAGAAVARPGRDAESRQPSRSTFTPKRAIRLPG
jgi:hypothetical protein